MAYTSQIRTWWGSYLKSADTLQRVWILGRYPVYVQPELVDAAEAMNQALVSTGYENPCDFIGSYNPRKIAGSDKWSLHSYGVAIDLDYNYDAPDRWPDKNPHLYRRIRPGDPGFGVEFQLTEADVNAVEGIKNLQGEQIWRWLGWAIGDTMHFQVDVPPSRCEVDWSTVGQEEDVDEFARQVLDLIGPERLEAARVAGAWSGETAWYFDGRSDAQAGANLNLVRHLFAWMVGTLPTAAAGSAPAVLQGEIDALEGRVDTHAASIADTASAVSRIQQTLRSV